MKRYLLTGLIILLPISLTLMIVMWLFDLFTEPFVGIIELIVGPYEKSSSVTFLRYESVILFISRLIALIFLFFFVLLLGFVGRRFFFKPLTLIINNIFSRIPFVKTIYRLSRDITKSIFDSQEKTFKRTVLVPFPHPETHALGFVTGEVPEIFKKLTKDLDTTVFIPTSPHPISGFVLFASQEKLADVEISTEDAFSFLLSCGAFHPEKKKEE